MQTLTLLRHAKSGYVDGLTDFKRHLTESGRRDATNMAKVLRKQHYGPTRLLVSSAVRTRETAQIVREILNVSEGIITHLSDLYLASPDVLLREISLAADTPHLMVIGHNPGLEVFSSMLDPRSPERMSTCSLHQFELQNSRDDATRNQENNRDTQSSDSDPDESISDTHLADPPDEALVLESRQADVPNVKGRSAASARTVIGGTWTANLTFHESPLQ